MKKLARRPYRLERTDKSVITLRFDDVRHGWEQWFLLTTDRHWDHPTSDRDMQRRHLDEARAKNAGIMDAGDLFCVMQGRDDKRGDKGSIRPEHNSTAYLSVLQSSAADWFAPWADLWVFAAPGNHETGILQKKEVEMTGGWLLLMNQKCGTDIPRQTYAGWVRFMFTCRGAHRQSIRLFYHHGWGGGGPVTRGVIDTNRMAVYQDAEIVWTGHTHDQWIVPIRRQRLNDRGVPYLDEQLHVRTPGYKDEYSLMEGFHVERGRGPKPIGAAWLRFWYHQDHVWFDITRAL